MRTFSFRYRSWFGVEGAWETAARQFTLRIVIIGLTIGITGGVSVGADG